MSSTDAFALQRSDLNGFLFADVGIEATGNRLSVLSVLARLGVDPWQEAARLAKLPRIAATNGLAGMIVAMPASPWSLPDATEIATRLVAMLPKQTASLPGRSIANASSALPGGRMGWVVVAILLGGVIGGLVMNVSWTSAPDSASKPTPALAPAAPIPARP